MNPSEKIEKLQELLKAGAISEEEFQLFSKDIEIVKTNHSEENEVPSAPLESNLLSDSKVSEPINANNIVSAGECLQKAVSFQITSFVFSILSGILVCVTFVNILSKAMKGERWNLDNLGVSSFFVLIFAVLALVYWIKSLSKINRAGFLFMTSESSNSNKSDSVYNNINPDRKSIKIKPNTKTSELKGLKIGQNFAGGIIAYFDESGMYAMIVSNVDLNVKMSLEQAKSECRKLSLDGFSDWFLPEPDELHTIFSKLHLNKLGNFKNDIYWCSLYAIDFSKKKSLNIFTKNELYFVRPVRVTAI